MEIQLGEFLVWPIWMADHCSEKTTFSPKLEKKVSKNLLDRESCWAGKNKTTCRPADNRTRRAIHLDLSFSFPVGSSVSLSRPMAASSFLCCRGKISRKKRREENSWRETEKKNRSRKPECWFIDSWRKLLGYLSSFVILISYNFSNETRKRKDSQSIGPSRKKEKKRNWAKIFFFVKWNGHGIVGSAISSTAGCRPVGGRPFFLKKR